MHAHYPQVFNFFMYRVLQPVGGHGLQQHARTHTHTGRVIYTCTRTHRKRVTHTDTHTLNQQVFNYFMYYAWNGCSNQWVVTDFNNTVGSLMYYFCNMGVCVYACVCGVRFVYVRVYVRVHVLGCAWVCLRTCVGVRLRIRVHVCVSVNVRTCGVGPCGNVCPPPLIDYALYHAPLPHPPPHLRQLAFAQKHTHAHTHAHTHTHNTQACTHRCTKVTGRTGLRWCARTRTDRPRP